MNRALALAAIVLLVLAGATRVASADELKPMRVGSKRFVESYILAEIVAQLSRAQGIRAADQAGPLLTGSEETRETWQTRRLMY